MLLHTAILRATLIARRSDLRIPKYTRNMIILMRCVVLSRIPIADEKGDLWSAITQLTIRRVEISFQTADNISIPLHA